MPNGMSSKHLATLSLELKRESLEWEMYILEGRNLVCVVYCIISSSRID